MTARGPRKGAPRPAGPCRTCIGCGRKALKGELRRLVVVDGVEGGTGQGGDGEGRSGGAVRVDPTGAMPGRGAYLCGPGCLAAAVKRKAFGRAFKGKAGPLELERLEVALRES